ncbi:MAG: ATP-binding protein [Clostridia bacterium]|nr:ATP-binding protein [Clostridia bacterium]
MEIKRNKYLNAIVERKNNKLIKVITGLRRSGKSYLLNKVYKSYLLEHDILASQIITFAFDNLEDVMKLDKYLPNEQTIIYDSKKNYIVNPRKFTLYINDLTKEDRDYYLLLDEIQLLDNFVFALNGLLSHDNFDIYVTGSNSRMLSKDVITEFRGRGDQIHIYPLSFKEYYEASKLSFEEAYLEYQYYGGMPYLINLNGDERKQEYLKQLFSEIYIKDITERNGIKDIESFEKLLCVLSSSIGSYTNPTNLEKTFKSVENIIYGHAAIKNHIEFIKDAFLISEAKRYDIKGKKYIGSNSKYYFTDIGLRNALINFRQTEPTHIMENIIYNELINRGYNVDVGIVEINVKNENGNYVSKQLETDFVCNKLYERIYIQSAYSMESLAKQNQEKRSLLNIKDNFKKVIIVKDNFKKYITEEGIEVVSLKEWLLGGD